MGADLLSANTLWSGYFLMLASEWFVDCAERGDFGMMGLSARSQQAVNPGKHPGITDHTTLSRNVNLPEIGPVHVSIPNISVRRNKKVTIFRVCKASLTPIVPHNPEK